MNVYTDKIAKYREGDRAKSSNSDAKFTDNRPLYHRLSQLKETIQLDPDPEVETKKRSSFLFFFKKRYLSEFVWLVDDNAYGEAIKLFRDWAMNKSGGSAGWEGHIYSPVRLHILASAVQSTFEELRQFPVLNNQQNKTLIAIRTIRGNESMAEKTFSDLCWILQIVSSNLSGIKEQVIFQSIECDPSEAHPNTLPTAKIVTDKGVFYFKGRSGAVEAALVGSCESFAKSTDLESKAEFARTGIGGTDGERIGIHEFWGNDVFHISRDVGSGGKPQNISVPEVVAAWLSAINTAMMVAIVGLGDLLENPSNLVDGADGKKHVIDAEFLLCIFEKKNYEESTTKLYNFDIKKMLPEWLIDYMKTHLVQWGVIREAVLGRFAMMDLSKHIESRLASVRNVIKSDAMLRVTPFTTKKWLWEITSYLNGDNHDIAPIIKELGFKLEEAGINLTLNKEVIEKELIKNFTEGMVPLFHVLSFSGRVLMNKANNLEIGHLVDGLTISKYQDFLRDKFLKAYQERWIETEIIKIFDELRMK